jgi:hypothetical protein
MYLYIFGSYCRGEIDQYSDIDLLVIKDKDEILPQFDLDKYSIYNLDRIQNLWDEGNPFAWHLFLESKLIFSNDNKDVVRSLGKPNIYSNHTNDMNKFLKLYLESKNSLIRTNDSRDFDLSMIFLALRNFASCYSLGYLKNPNFSRNSSIEIGIDSIKISDECYSILKNSRILSTRGIGKNVSDEEVAIVINELEVISEWFKKLITKTHE